MMDKRAALLAFIKTTIEAIEPNIFRYNERFDKRTFYETTRAERLKLMGEASKYIEIKHLGNDNTLDRSCFPKSTLLLRESRHAFG